MEAGSHLSLLMNEWDYIIHWCTGGGGGGEPCIVMFSMLKTSGRGWGQRKLIIQILCEVSYIA